MVKRFIAVLVALVVGTVVITAGVMLYHLSPEWFRPDFNKVGGTEVVLEVAQADNDEDVEKACLVLRKRFDEPGSGVEVRRDGAKHVAVAVPASRRHDSIVGQVHRLGAKRGRVEFRLVANPIEDKDATKLAEQSFLAMKGLPAKPGEAGEEIVAGAGVAKRRYRWFRLSDGQAREWVRYNTGRGTVVGGADRWVRTTDLNHVSMFGVDRGGGADAYFVLCREPEEGAAIGGEVIDKVRVAALDHYHEGRLEITFSEEGAAALRNVTGPYVVARHTARPEEYRALACIVDGEVAFAHELIGALLRKQTFSVHATASDAEDLAALLRGGELPVKINPASVKERIVARAALTSGRRWPVEPQVKERLKAVEATLADVPFAEVAAFERDGRTLHVGVTARLRKCARKEGVWRSRELFATLKNAAYGYDERQARSVGGRDGIFLLDRTFRPANEMMRKLFDRYLDREGSGAAEVAQALGVPLAGLLPVRLVSHHLRLLGVLARREDGDWLVLVDCDRSE